MKSKLRFSLSKKLCLGFAILGIILCVVSTIVGQSQYNRYIKRQYNDTAYQIAETVRGYISDEDIAMYSALVRNPDTTQEQLDEAKASEQYTTVTALLDSLRESMNANDIYIAYVDLEIMEQYSGAKEGWNPMLYMFDSYMIPEYRFVLGDRYSFNPEFMEDAREFMTVGGRPSNYFISKSDFGYNTSAILPIKVDGEVVGVIGVEIPMSTLQSALKDYVIHSAIVFVVVIVICILLLLAYYLRFLIRPIRTIVKETSRFVDQDNHISDVLLTIRTGDETQSLAESIMKMENDINTYIFNITKVTAEKERIGAELNVATQIQANMLPSIFPAFPGRPEFDIFASMHPAKEVGGDFYDFFLIDDNHLGMVIADVSGKGVPAALFMVICKTLIKNAATQSQLGPKELLTSVNEQLCENNKADMFCTAWIGIMEISTGNVIAGNAGHEYPAIRRAGGQFELIKDKHAMPLGTMEGLRFREYEFNIGNGDTLFVYTDGVAEATNSSDELYGTDRMLNALNVNPDGDPSELLSEVNDSIKGFVKDAPQFDDITMLAMKRH